MSVRSGALELVVVDVAVVLVVVLVAVLVVVDASVVVVLAAEVDVVPEPGVGVTVSGNLVPSGIGSPVGIGTYVVVVELGASVLIGAVVDVVEVVVVDVDELASGVISADGNESGPVPNEFVALTVNMYGKPLLSPLTVHGLAEQPTVGPLGEVVIQ